jgi:hypothetical protein
MKIARLVLVLSALPFAAIGLAAGVWAWRTLEAELRGRAATGSPGAESG